MKFGLTYIMLLVASAALVGCSLVSVPPQSSAPVNNVAVPVHDHVPVLPVPEKPKQELLTKDELAEFNKLSDGLKKRLLSNDAVVKSYAEQLNVAVEKYNAWATQQNALSQAAIDSLGKGK